MGGFRRPLLDRGLARLVGLDEESARRGAKLVEAALDTKASAIGAVGTPGDRTRLFQFLLEQLAQREDSVCREADENDSLSLLVNAKKRGARLGNDQIASNMITILLSSIA